MVFIMRANYYIQRALVTVAAFGLVFSPIAVHAMTDREKINNGQPVEHVKSDKSSWGMIKGLIAGDAVKKGKAKSHDRAAKRYHAYAKKLATVLAQYSYQDQQAIIFGQ